MLKTISGPGAIQGITGQLSFQGSNPQNKALVIVCIDNTPHLHMLETAGGRFLLPPGMDNKTKKDMSCQA